ncbi:hypothetical protein BX616_005644 [Lobosporangium transversale]|nr:hypothetical protein BX616_005644 [Lobosporangium transversale]
MDFNDNNVNNTYTASNLSTDGNPDPSTLEGNSTPPSTLPSNPSIPEIQHALPPEILQAISALTQFIQNGGAFRQPGTPTQDPFMRRTEPLCYLEPYEDLEQVIPSLKRRKEFHTVKLNDEEQRYYDISQFPKVAGMEYTPPAIPKEWAISDSLKNADQKLVTLATKAAHITRPLDAAAHAIVSQNGTNDVQVQYILRILDTVRTQISTLCEQINKIRTEAFVLQGKEIYQSS